LSVLALEAWVELISQPLQPPQLFAVTAETTVAERVEGVGENLEVNRAAIQEAYPSLAPVQDHLQ
jgi:hypothetical protein